MKTENGESLFSRNFILLTACFICPVTIAAIFFLLSGYLASLHFDSGRIGVIVSADSLAALVLQFIVSPFIHNQNVKRWLLLGITLLTCGLFIVGNSLSFYVLVAGRLLQGAGFVIVLSSLMTLIVNFIPRKKSGSAFGLLSLIRLVPYALIPLFCEMKGIEPSSLGDRFNIIYLLAVFPLLAIFVRIGMGEGGRKPATSLNAIKAVFADKRIVYTMLSSFFLFAGYSAVFFYIKAYGEHIGLKDAGLFLTVETAGMFGVRLFFSGFFDRYNKVWLIFWGIIASVVSYVLIPVVGDSLVFFVLAGVCGLGWGVAMPVQNAYLFDISDNSQKAINQNLMLSMMQAGFFVGTLTGSQVIGLGGYTAFFMYIGVLTLLAAGAQLLTLQGHISQSS